MTTYQKAKSVSKKVTPRGKALNGLVLQTMGRISEVVGNTLGPGGMPVLIERAEHDLPPFVTKDGVTVYRALGFEDPIAQCIMEMARDASIRTASEAGDGTTTATVLSEAIIRNTMKYIDENPKVSPQRVVRILQNLFSSAVEPTVKALAFPIESGDEDGRAIMHKIASTSANGDTDLADAVLEAFEISGDDGNVTIVEASGPSRYEVEHITGYPIAQGYEDSIGRYYAKFINDEANQRVILDNPVFVLYNGKITEYQTIYPILLKVSEAFVNNKYNHNVVVVATGFSESVMGHLAQNISMNETINVVPLLVPLSPQMNGQTAFLHDLAAVTGATVLDPIESPLEQATLEDLGAYDLDENSEAIMKCSATAHFEMSRFRASILSNPNDPFLEGRLADRMAILEAGKAQAGASQLDSMLLQERIAKLTGGIARLRVYGSSNGELKEKRDRADDAVCALRGALKHGALPGGCWAMMYTIAALQGGNSEWSEDTRKVCEEILIPSLKAPISRLLSNAGFTEEEARVGIELVQKNALLVYSGAGEDPLYVRAMEGAVIVDVNRGESTSAFRKGVIDSTPAVLEAIRNSLSVASLLGSLGGTVVFYRDSELERAEAKATAQFERAIATGEIMSAADERP